MAIEQITSSILKEAEQKKQEILQEASVEKSKLIKAAEEQAGLTKKKILEKAREEADLRRRTALIRSQMESKKRLLSLKREMLDSVFEKAVKAVPLLPSSDYQGFAAHVLLQSIGTGTEEVRLNRNESERLGGDFWQKIAIELRKTGRRGELRIVTDDSVSDGFIVRGEREQIDCRISTIIKEMKPEIETEVSRILFGEFAMAVNS